MCGRPRATVTWRGPDNGTLSNSSRFSVTYRSFMLLYYYSLGPTPTPPFFGALLHLFIFSFKLLINRREKNNTKIIFLIILKPLTPPPVLHCSETGEAVLNILGVSVEDGGVYTCVATNVSGSVTSSASLRVAGGCVVGCVVGWLHGWGKNRFELSSLSSYEPLLAIRSHSMGYTCVHPLWHSSVTCAILLFQ